MKIDLFQSCGSCWVFQICWHSECSTLTALSLGIWNSSAGIASHPLALFVIVLLKAHLTLYSRMSGSTWVITPLCFFQVIKTFLCHFVFLPHSSLVAQLVKNPPAIQEIPVRFLGREDLLGGGGHGNPLQYSCLENPHRLRSREGYSSWDHKESDTTEYLSVSTAYLSIS